MYYRNPDYMDLDRFTKPVRAMPESKPLGPRERLLLSMGMIAMPVAALFLVLGLGRLVNGL
jgi:hypothetical protein